MKTVFVLGAGASNEAGAPLMSDFLERAKRLLARNAYGQESSDIRDVLQAALVDQKPVQVKSNIAYHNIEELFSAIDIGSLIQSFGSRPPELIDKLRQSIVTFIYRTIEETVRIPFTNGTIGAPRGYGMLAELVKQRVEESAPRGINEISFITFNYDTCLEFALARRGLRVDYALNEPLIDPLENQQRFGVPVLKLHGSINWASCPTCNVIVPTEIDPWRRSNPIDLMDRPSELPLMLGSRIARAPHRCGAALNPVPVLVPPTWNKSSSSAALRAVWQRAAQELGHAENIVVIGYSLPPTDMFFKYLFALGTNSDSHLESFTIINGIRGDDTAPRFKSLLGPMTSDGFQSHPLVFSGAGAAIRNVLWS